MDHCSSRLMAAILDLSEASDWDEARKEWDLQEVYFTEVPGTCLCSHFPIIEHCLIGNRLNGNEATVGNVCVTRFIGLPSSTIFAAFKRIAVDPKCALNLQAITFAHGKYWLTDWEREFSIDTMKKRKLSPKQLAIRIRINECVSYWVRNASMAATE